MQMAVQDPEMSSFMYVDRRVYPKKSGYLESEGALRAPLYFIWLSMGQKAGDASVQFSQLKRVVQVCSWVCVCVFLGDGPFGFLSKPLKKKHSQKHSPMSIYIYIHIHISRYPFSAECKITFWATFR